MSPTTRGAKKTKQKFTKEEILADWKKTLKAALKGKRLDKAIIEQFEPALLVAIQSRLDTGGDYKKEGRATRTVAKFIGEVCRELTPGNSVSLGVFEKVFNLAQLHPACPGGGPGSGQWCEV